MCARTRTGKILIQRDEQSAEKSPIMFYSKLPPNVSSFENVLLVDPMLATGGSVLMAIKVGLSRHDTTACLCMMDCKRWWYSLTTVALACLVGSTVDAHCRRC